MCGMKRKVPYGVMNWDEVVRECYLVDNTAYIRALEGLFSHGSSCPALLPADSSFRAGILSWRVCREAHGSLR